MLERLEISEINTSAICQLENRLDAEFYQKEYFVIESKIKAKPWKTLKDLGACLDCSAFYPSVAEDYNFSAVGIPFLRVNEIVDGKIIFTDATAFLPESIIKINKDTIHIAHNKDILIAKGGNTAGKIGYLSEKYPEYATCRDVVILRTESMVEINPPILAIYLSSKYGKRLIERTISQTGQPHLTLPLLERLPIPLFSHNLQKKISNIENMIISLNQKSIQLYNGAEAFLEEELGLSDWQPTKESIATKTFADFQKSGRLDAEYYQPKYDEIAQKIASYHRGISLLQNCFKHITESAELSADSYKYIEIGDVNVSTGEATYNTILTDDLPANAKYNVKKGNILISKVRPNRGAVAIIENSDQDLICSGAFTVLEENTSCKKEVLISLLRTPIYRDWLLKWNVGSSYPVIKDDDILNLPIPLIEDSVQKEIAAKIQESFALRKKSKRLLDLAKHAVEVAIEQGEENAMQLLKTNSRI